MAPAKRGRLPASNTETVTTSQPKRSNKAPAASSRSRASRAQAPEEDEEPTASEEEEEEEDAQPAKKVQRQSRQQQHVVDAKKTPANASRGRKGAASKNQALADPEEDEDEEEEEEEEEAEEKEEEEHEDEEEAPPAKRKGRAPASAIPSSKRAAGRGKARAEVEEEEEQEAEENDDEDGQEDASEDEDAPPNKKSRARQSKQSKKADGTLFEIVKMGRSAIKSVIDDWIESYTADPETGMATLLTFFVQSCGCNIELSTEMTQSNNLPAAVRTLTQSIDTGDAYPIKSAAKDFRKFKSGLIQFCEKFIQCCRKTILFTSNVLEDLITWLTALTTSQVRAFRHTATLISMKLTTSLVSILSETEDEAQSLERQADAEKSRQPKPLRDRLATLQSEANLLFEIVENIFKGVFLHRYRDAVGEIRSLCITELGAWIAACPRRFLNNDKVKYIAWTLHDKDPEVRLTAVRVISEKLYTDETFHASLADFTSRFLSRMIEIVDDVDPTVSAAAIRLATQLLANNNLEPEHVQRVATLVFAENRLVATAAGFFLAELIKRQTTPPETTSSPVRTQPKGKKGAAAAAAAAPPPLPPVSTATRSLKALLQWFCSDHDDNVIKPDADTQLGLPHAAYFIDGLWDSIRDLLVDWNAYLELLNSDARLNQIDSQDDEALVELPSVDVLESSLLDLMSMAALRATGECIAPARFPTASARKMTPKDKQEAEEEREQLSITLIPVINKLFEKYKADPTKIARLAAIVQCFNPEVYVSHRLQGHLAPLLKSLNHAITTLVSREGITQCIHATAFLAESVQTSAEAETVLATLTEDLSGAKLTKAVKAVLAKDGHLHTRRFPLWILLQRSIALLGHRGIESPQFYESLNLLLSKAVDDFSNVHFTLIMPTVTAMSLNLGWELMAAQTPISKKGSMDTLKIDQVVERRDIFFSQLQHLLSHPNTAVAADVFIAFTDLLLLFAPQWKEQKTEDLHVLSFTANAILEDDLKTAFDRLVVQTASESDNSDTAAGADVADGDYEILAGDVDEQPDTLVDTDDQEDETLNSSPPSVLCQKRAFLGFSRCILFGNISLQASVNIIANYELLNARHGGLIKHTISKMREIDSVAASHQNMAALKQLYLSHADPEVLHSTARRLVNSYGIAYSDSQRRGIVAALRDGIQFIFDGDNLEDTEARLPFFKTLALFLPRLNPTDVTHIDKALESSSNYVEANDADDVMFEPMHEFTRKLNQRRTGKDVVDAEDTAPKKAAAARKRAATSAKATAARGVKAVDKQIKNAEAIAAAAHRLANLNTSNSSTASKSKGKRPQPLEEDDEIQDDEEELVHYSKFDTQSQGFTTSSAPSSSKKAKTSHASKAKGSSSLNVSTASTSSKRVLHADSDDNDDDVAAAPPARKQRTSAAAVYKPVTMSDDDEPAAPTKRLDEDSDDDDLVRKPGSPAKKTTKGRK